MIPQEIEVKIDNASGMITFTQKSQSGITLVQPPIIQMPIPQFINIACQMIPKHLEACYAGINEMNQRLASLAAKRVE